MNFVKTTIAAAAGVFGMLQAAHAGVVGVAVDGIGGNEVAGAVFAPGEGVDGDNNELGRDAIGYFIPLSEETSGVFGVDGVGQSSDTGTGGSLTMFLRFSPVVIGSEGTLSILFQDLDLGGVNDPTGFFESIQIFDASGEALTMLITDINELFTPGVGDDDAPQLLQLALAGDLFDGEEFFVQLNFTSSFTSAATNTIEFLAAEVSQVPLPAALPMFLAGIAGFGFAARRKKAA